MTERHFEAPRAREPSSSATAHIAYRRGAGGDCQRARNRSNLKAQISARSNGGWCMGRTRFIIIDS